MTILLGWRRVRARQSNCFWPWDSWTSSTVLSREPWALNKLPSWTFWSTSSKISSYFDLVGSRFRRMGPSNKNGSWGMATSLDLTRLLGSLEISMPSMWIEPSESSIILNIARIREVFPLYFDISILFQSINEITMYLPLPPQTPIFSPGAMHKLRPFSARLYSSL